MLNRSSLSAQAQSSDKPPYAEADQQILWHVGRQGAPSVTATLVRMADIVELHVTCANTARQPVVCASSLTGAKRAERLLRRLEARGYRRTRLPNRGYARSRPERTAQ